MKNIVGTCVLCGGHLECVDEITSHIICDTCDYQEQYFVVIDTWNIELGKENDTCK